jgi:hypothetical protein
MLYYILLYADINGQRNIRKQERFWRDPIRFSPRADTVLFKRIRAFPDIEGKCQNDTLKYVTTDSSVIIFSY